MNIEFLDEAGRACPLSERSHWQEGDRSDLAEVHYSCLSLRVPAVITDRGLWATASKHASPVQMLSRHVSQLLSLQGTRTLKCVVIFGSESNAPLVWSVPMDELGG